MIRALPLGTDVGTSEFRSHSEYLDIPLAVLYDETQTQRGGHCDSDELPRLAGPRQAHVVGAFVSGILLTFSLDSLVFHLLAGHTSKATEFSVREKWKSPDLLPAGQK